MFQILRLYTFYYIHIDSKNNVNERNMTSYLSSTCMVYMGLGVGCYKSASYLLLISLSTMSPSLVREDRKRATPSLVYYCVVVYDRDERTRYVRRCVVAYIRYMDHR